MRDNQSSPESGYANDARLPPERHGKPINFHFDCLTFEVSEVVRYQLTSGWRACENRELEFDGTMECNLNRFSLHSTANHETDYSDLLAVSADPLLGANGRRQSWVSQVARKFNIFLSKAEVKLILVRFRSSSKNSTRTVKKVQRL